MFNMVYDLNSSEQWMSKIVCLLVLVLCRSFFLDSIVIIYHG